jgi:hypothetical protein
MTSIQHPATVRAVTGPVGTDVGPFCAWLGADLDDGLAIRTVRSGRTPADRRDAFAHVSPLPWAAGQLAPAPSGLGAQHPDGGVPLWALPSAWHNPDTSLGVAYTGSATRDLTFDVATLDAMGCNPAHRITVQHTSLPRGREGLEPVLVPAPIEIGNLAEIARDSVLRGSPERPRRVLIEAGDGQTLMEAFSTVGLAPWSPHIDVLDLWIVIDADRLIAQHGLSYDGSRDRLADAVIATAGVVARDNGGGLNRRGEWVPAPWLAIANVQALLPGLAGVTAEEFATAPADGGPVSEALADQLSNLLIVIENRAQIAVGAISTGPGPRSPWISATD